MNLRHTKPIKKVDLEYILNFYDAYLRERTIPKTAAAMEITGPSLLSRIENHHELKVAMAIADKNRSKNLLKNYIIRNLNEEGKKIWHKLCKEADSLEAIEKIFQGKPVKFRQQLFVHAIMSTGWDISKAMRLVGINRPILEKWKHDLEFMQLMEEIQFHKKNFFENALFSLVSDGHPGAIIFVNQTQNADRGYNPRLEIKNVNQTDIGAGNFSIEDLDLDLDTQKKLLEAIQKRKNQQSKALPAPSSR